MNSRCLQHCNEHPFYVYPEKELRGLSPDFHIHVFVSVSHLNIPRMGPHIFPQSRIGRRIVEIYKSLTQSHECGNWDWGRPFPFLGIFVSNFRYCVFAVRVSFLFSSCFVFVSIYKLRAPPSSCSFSIVRSSFWWLWPHIQQHPISRKSSEILNSYRTQAPVHSYGTV